MNSFTGIFSKILSRYCEHLFFKTLLNLFKNVGERSTAKNYHSVSLLSVVNEVFEKLVNNRIIDLLEKWALFSDFENGFWSSWSTANLLTNVSDRIARAFNRSGATQAVALDISTILALPLWMLRVATKRW